MKAIISSTYDDKYLYFIPIVTWCWKQLGVDVICFMPKYINYDKTEEGLRISKRLELSKEVSGEGLRVKYFDAPEHKEATYAQCSRLYGACLDLPENEVLITGDIDMALFNLPGLKNAVSGIKDYPFFEIVGADLTPPNQFPICYLCAPVREWRTAFNINGRTYQECLDDELGELDSLHFRGNFWSRDQELAYNYISKQGIINKGNRAKEGTQFSTRRYDRDDAYILDRLSPDTIDFHMPRPGFEDRNFEIILTILKYHYPDSNFDWLVNYNNAYKELL